MQAPANLRDARYLGFVSLVFVIELGLYYLSAFIPNEFGPTSDYTIIPYLVCIPITFLAFLALLKRKKKQFNFSFNYIWLAVHIGALFGFLWLCQNDSRAIGIRYSQATVVVIEVLVLRLLCWSCLFMIVDFRSFLRDVTDLRKVLWVMLFANSCSALFLLSNSFLWKHLAKATGFLVTGILIFFGHPVTMSSNADGIVLADRFFTISIAAPCSGLEGIFFFFSVYSLVLLLDWELFCDSNILNGYLGGFIYMFCVNAIRIAGFFGIATARIAKDGKTKASESLIDAFHQGLGWVFYLAAIVLALLVLYTRGTPRPKLIAEPAS